MAQPTPPPPSSPPPNLYNLDDDAAFNECLARLEQAATDNFIVRFDSSEATCAVDVRNNEAIHWLQKENRVESQALWLNFWTSESQRPIIQAVAKKYDLSPRLIGLLCPARSSRSPSHQRSTGTAAGTGTTSTGSGSTSTSLSSSADPTKASQTQATDVEKGPPPAQAPPLRLQKPMSAWFQTLKGITFGDIVKDLWHFCSVDFGRHYIYIGFNALYLLPDGHDGTDGDDQGSSTTASSEGTSKPAGERIWSSLLICDDGTVISVFERPLRPDAHDVTRYNVRNVFRHLSKQHNNDDSQDSLTKVRVRWHEQATAAATTAAGYNPTEAASLLFYYLFDDWLFTYALIARNPYRERLKVMRQRMFNAAEVSLIQQVHDVGRQLTVLKLMYQSYELIVSRLLLRQRSVAQGPADGVGAALSRRDTLAMQSRVDPSDEHSDFLDEDSGGLSVKLSMSAVVRFERLLGRIRLYALTEIEECLKEKESLVFMNFNLVTLKESQAVERLTRTTILLAKATILFLPVSLMTGYFSIQLPEIEQKYSLKTYWLCFLVVSILSIAFLFLFGVTTHTVEGKTIYRSITRSLGRMILDKGRGKGKRKAH